jgi:ubiquitin carboxyl-terminal hydrolase 34
LFPELPSDGPYAEPMIPYCIQSETRGALFDVVFKLANTQSTRNLISAFLKDLIDAGTSFQNLLTPLDSDIFPDDHYIDRCLWLQAPSRLTGIHNLSNTCYMNSLVNQLFMNIDFRNFIYSVDVDDPEGSQTLLHQIQYLFARLQLGNDKAALPQELAHAIIDFEGQPINIHIQMDVDEFFNLLFDRIEGQFKNMEERSRFRQLYGGVLRHTIKSKECTHVSSREEDFAAIQCDVRGKQNLEESLASYVKGEMMDGGTLFEYCVDF